MDFFNIKRWGLYPQISLKKIADSDRFYESRANEKGKQS
jgi:hypothetical protein